MVERHLGELRFGQDRVDADSVVTISIEKAVGGREQMLALGGTGAASLGPVSHATEDSEMAESISRLDSFV